MTIDTIIKFINLSIYPKAEFLRRIKEEGMAGVQIKKKGKGTKHMYPNTWSNV